MQNHAPPTSAARTEPLQDRPPIWALIPDDMWPSILKYWPQNYTLKDVCTTRLLCRQFAHELRWRVVVHTPSAKQFVDELRLVQAYQNRSRPMGAELYSRAHTMIFNRHTERPIATHGTLERLHLRLCMYMSTEGRAMDKSFDGFVSRIATYLNRTYTERFEGYSLLTAFGRIRESPGPIATVQDYMTLSRGALSVIPPEPPGGYDAAVELTYRMLKSRRSNISFYVQDEFEYGV